MGVDLLSSSWNRTEMIQWKETVDPIIYGTNVGLCFIAQVIFYIFPRLRVFPRSIISWVNIYNLFYNTSLVIKWLPQSVLHESWVINLKPGSPICLAGIWLDNAGIFGPLCCTFLLCLTMFLRIVVREDIEGKRIYFWGYLGVATIVPFVIASIAAFGYVNTGTVFGVCVVGDPGAVHIRILSISLFFIQVVLFLVTMIYIRRAFASVNNTTTSSSTFPMSYLVVRFSAMFLCQLIALLPVQISFLFYNNTKISNNAIFSRFSTVAGFLGKALESFVLIFGNVDFIDWLKKKYYEKIKGKQPNSHQSIMVEKESPQKIEGGLSMNDELEMIHLSSSAQKMGSSTPKHFEMVGKTSLEEQESSDIVEGLSEI